MGRQVFATRRVSEGEASQHDSTVVDADQTGERAKGRRLAGTVRTEKRDHLAVAHVKFQVEPEVPATDADCCGETGYHRGTQRLWSKTSTRTETASSSTDSSSAAPGSVSSAR